jgi:hypothetical protein
MASDLPELTEHPVNVRFSVSKTLKPYALNPEKLQLENTLLFSLLGAHIPYVAPV